MTPKDLFFAQIKLSIEPSIKRAFATKADNAIYTEIELSDHKTLRIEADPSKGTFSMNSPRVSINGKIDKDFNIHSCAPKAILATGDDDYQKALDGLLANVIEFRQKPDPDKNLKDSEFSPFLPGQ
mgnify:CR=1 FL=1